MIAHNPVINRLIPWIIILGLIIIYTSTMSTYVHLEDDGAFITSAFFNGIAHPPGYPLYTIISHIFTGVEISTVAARVHFVSVVFGAISIVCIYFIIHLLTGRVFAALIASLVLAFSEQFWSQAIIAEVYVLNTAIFFAMLYVLLKMYLQKNVRKESIHTPIKHYLMISAFLLGLGLSNHWPLFVLSSVGLLLLVLPYWQAVLFNLHILILLLFAGLTPYVWMYYCGSNSNDFIAFGDINNLQELVYYISRQGYSNVDQSAAAGWTDKLSFLEFFLSQSVKQFSLPVLLGIVTGMALLLKRKPLLAMALIIVLSGNTLLLVLLLGFDFDGFHRIIFMPYPLIAYGILCIFLGVFIGYVSEKLTTSRLVKPVLLLLAALPLFMLVRNYPLMDRTDDSWAEDFSSAILGELPPDAILFVSSDFDTGPLGYMHYVKKIRPDIMLYQADGALYPNRLFHPYRHSIAEKRGRLNQFITAQKRPVYSTEYLHSDLPQHNMGVLWAINNSPDIATMNELNQSIEAQLNIYDKNVGWVELHKLTLAKNLLKFYKPAIILTPSFSGRLTTLTSHFESQVPFLEIVIQQAAYLQPSYFEQLLMEMDKTADEFLLKETRAKYLYLKALIYIQVYKKPEASIPLLEESVMLNPVYGNQAIKLLLEWYVKHNQANKLAELSALTGIQFKY